MEYIEKIKEITTYKGVYLININSEGFVKPNTFSFELSQLSFNTARQSADSTLLSFSNKYNKPMEFTDKNTPVYPMDISTAFYINTKDIIHINELTQDECRDEFSYLVKKGFNLHINDKTIITIGFLGGQDYN